MLALSGISSDMRPIEEGYLKGEPKCVLAFDIYAYRLAKFIASYYVPLGHVDAISFAGGIGENSDIIRKLTCDLLKEPFGLEIDDELNSKFMGFKGNGSGKISTENSKSAVFMVQTNEELMIARSAMKFVK